MDRELSTDELTHSITIQGGVEINFDEANSQSHNTLSSEKTGILYKKGMVSLLIY